MYRKFIYSTIVITLSACGGGSSSDTPSADSDTTEAVNTSVSGESTGAVDMGVGSETTVDTTDNGGTNSGPVDMGNSSDVTQVGVIYLDVYDDSVEFEASFWSAPQNIIPFATLLEEFRPVLDTCEVNTTESMFTGGEIPDITDIIDESLITILSAGEVLTVSSPAGSYAELVRRQQFGFTFYSIDDDVELSAPAPSNLNISIPGDQFPAFTNIALPAVEPLQVSSPGLLEPITASTNFSWTGSTNPNSFVEITAFSFSIAEGLTSVTSVDCQVVDDGSFSFSAATQAELGAFNALGGDVDRFAVRLEQQGNSVLVLSTASERVN